MRLTHPVEAVHLLQPLLNQSNQLPLRKLLNTQNNRSRQDDAQNEQTGSTQEDQGGVGRFGHKVTTLRSDFIIGVNNHMIRYRHQVYLLGVHAQL